MAGINEDCKAFSMDALWDSIPGFTFEPTDKELVQHYLKRKIKNLPIPNNMIQDLNIYDHTIEQLKVKYKPDGYSKDLYFFTPRDREFLDEEWLCRVVSDGYWKATGTDQVILGHRGSKIGFKKTFLFYRGKAPEVLKTSWVMHEYRLQEKEDHYPKHLKLDIVLCKISKTQNIASIKVKKTQGKASISIKKTHDRDENDNEVPLDDVEINPMNDDEDATNSTDCLMNNNNPINEDGRRPAKQRRFL